MILKLGNGKITVLENTVEDKQNAIIRLRFENEVITNGDVIKIYIDNEEVERLDNETWKFNHSIHLGKENKIEVAIISRLGIKKFTTHLEIKEYLSFGSMPFDKFPQVFADQNDKISKLEKRIKTLENKEKFI